MSNALMSFDRSAWCHACRYEPIKPRLRRVPFALCFVQSIRRHLRIGAPFIGSLLRAVVRAIELLGIGEEPLSRMATPEDIANAVAFLALDEASYITGATVTMDGGMVPVVV
jgi:NAD(P)-dependent dehydrogenase (short-subunit alcohol dehydrogenase family)